MAATFPASPAPTIRAPRRASSRPTDRRQAARTALAEHLATHDPLAHVDLTVPERTWARVGTGVGADVWLITWPAGSSTGWHDHGSASGAFVVLTGSLTEYVFTGVATAGTLGASAVREFDGNHIHDVVNHGTEPAVSLHAYAPGLDAMTRYELVRGRLQVIGVEQRGESW